MAEIEQAVVGDLFRIRVVDRGKRTPGRRRAPQGVGGPSAPGDDQSGPRCRDGHRGRLSGGSAAKVGRNDPCPVASSRKKYQEYVNGA